MRTRNYEYEILPNERKTLHEIDCVYHLQGMKEGSIYGCIRYNDSIHLETAKKRTGDLTRPLQNDTMQQILEMDDLWEKGELKKRGRKSVTKDHTDTLCNIILKQQEEYHVLHKKYEACMKNQMNNTLAPTKSIVRHEGRLNDNWCKTECKDAVSFQEFIQKIELDHRDIEYVKTHDFVESITKILFRELDKYDMYHRPVHCADMKREVLYVKDETSGWIKGMASEMNVVMKGLSKIYYKQDCMCHQIYKDISVESSRFDEKASLLYKITKGSCSDQEKNNKKIVKQLLTKIIIK